MDFLAPPARGRSHPKAMPLRSYRTKQWLSESPWRAPGATAGVATAIRGAASAAHRYDHERPLPARR